MVALGQYYGNLDGHGAMIGVIYGGRGTPLSAVRSCEMGVTPKKALDIYGSLYLIIPYLLKDEQGDSEDKSRAWIGDTRG